MAYKSLKVYAEILSEVLSSTTEVHIQLLTDEIMNRINGEGEIYILGNGGSAANAHHIAGDFTKTFSMIGKGLKISCLSDNSCFLTAAANDIDFSEIYSLLINTKIKEKDLIIILSGSGNSMNLIKLARKAKSSGIKMAAILGYNGGALGKIVDIPVHNYIDDMEIAEDCQIVIFHYIKQKIVDLISPGRTNSSKYEKRTSQDLIA